MVLGLVQCDSLWRSPQARSGVTSECVFDALIEKTDSDGFVTVNPSQDPYYYNTHVAPHLSSVPMLNLIWQLRSLGIDSLWQAVSGFTSSANLCNRRSPSRGVPVIYIAFAEVRRLGAGWMCFRCTNSKTNSGGFVIVHRVVFWSIKVHRRCFQCTNRKNRTTVPSRWTQSQDPMIELHLPAIWALTS